MSREIDIGRLAPDDLQIAWPDVAEVISEQGEDLLRVHSPRELFTNVLSGIYDLWLATEDDEIQLVGFCAWERHDLASYYHVIWVGGSGLDLAKQAMIKLEHYACLHGAKELVLGGRPGWGRLLRPLGFVPQGKWSKNVETCWKH